MTESNYIQILIQGGAVGINIIILIIFYKISIMFNSTIQNYLRETNDIRKDEIENKTKITEVLTKLTDTVSGCPHNRFNK